MGTRKPCSATALTLALLCLSFGLVGCAGVGDAGDATLTGTALERAQRVLGTEPTGVAGQVVGRGYMVVANDADYAPQSSVDETTGELVGFDVDVAKKVGEILGLEVRFKNPDWEAVPTSLDQGRVDVSIGSMPITPQYDKVVDFTEPYYHAPAQVFVKQGGPQIGGVDDLAGKKVGVGIATTYYDHLKRNSDAIVKTYATGTDAYPDLRSGKLDFVLTAGPTGQQAILEGQPFQSSGKPLHYEDLGFAVTEGEVDWVKLLDHALDVMRGDGSLSDLSKKWYGGLDLTVTG
jgi:polar amino acid transport system substrate-binding protein